MKIMFKSLCVAILFAMAASASLTSCGESEVLTKGDAKSAIKKDPAFRDSSYTATFNTGYYEVSENDITTLKQLEKAGVITVKLTNVIEQKRQYSYSYWSGRTSYTVDVEHTFAQVDFTEAGWKYVVWNRPRLREDVEKDLKLNEKDTEEILPDFMNVEAATEENVAAVKETVGTVETDTTVAAVDSIATEEVVQEVVEEVAAPAAEADPYEAASSRINIKSWDVMLGKIKVVKAKEVFCPAEDAEKGTGTCTFIVEFYDKTPFGWVNEAPANGTRMQLKATLTRYNDMGWVVTSTSGME